MIYLDYAAATPVDEEVSETMHALQREHFHNPSGVTTASRNVKKLLENERSRIASAISAKSTEIVMTAGGTEANNLAISGVLRRNPDKSCLLSGLEHSSIKVPVHKWGHGLNSSVDEEGRLQPESIRKNIQDDTVLITVAYADSELGVIQPIKEIARVSKEIRTERDEQGIDTPLYFHVDASQAAGYLTLNVNRLGIDMMTLNAGKFYGPKQVAALYVRKDIELEPLIYGGGQEYGLRSGTESIAGAAGMALALEKAEKRRKQTAKKLKKQQMAIIETIQNIDGSAINGSLRHRLPNNINARFEDLHAEDLVLYLEQAGFVVGTGAACSVGKNRPSAALISIGLSENEANQSIRITLSHLIDDEDVRLFNKELPKTVKKVRSIKK